MDKLKKINIQSIKKILQKKGYKIYKKQENSFSFYYTVLASIFLIITFYSIPFFINTSSKFFKKNEIVVNNSNQNFNRVLEGKKMSKSDPSDLSRINLTDNKDDIVNKIKKAKTDNSPLPSDDKKLNERPEVENLLGIYSSLNNQKLSDSIDEFGGKNFSEFKQKLSELVVEKISPISYEINKLKKDNNFIDKILEEGAEKADKITSKKVKEMKKIVGF